MLPETPGVGRSKSVVLLGLAFTAGYGSAWLLRSNPAGFPALTGGAILLAVGIARRLRAERLSHLPAVLGLLDRLGRETAAGADLFVALGTIRRDLPDGPLRRGVDAALGGYARRLPLADCLRPLAAADRTLAGLAADIRRTGWEGSSSLAEVVALVHASAARRWDRGRAARVRLDRLEEQLPALQAFAAGWIAAGLAGLGFAAGVIWSAALIGPGLVALFLRNGRLRRLVRAAGGLAALFVLLPAAAGGPAAVPPLAAAPIEPAGTPVRLDRLGDPLPIARPEYQPITDPVLEWQIAAAPELCRIETGVPGGLVNVRDRPGMGGRVRIQAVDGALLQVIGESGDYSSGVWRRIRTVDGRSGWVYAPLCPVVDE